MYNQAFRQKFKKHGEAIDSPQEEQKPKMQELRE